MANLYQITCQQSYHCSYGGKSQYIRCGQNHLAMYKMSLSNTPDSCLFGCKAILNVHLVKLTPGIRFHSSLSPLLAFTNTNHSAIYSTSLADVHPHRSLPEVTEKWASCNKGANMCQNNNAGLGVDYCFLAV